MKVFSVALCMTALMSPVMAASATDPEIQRGYEQSIAARGANRPDIAEKILRKLVEQRPNAGQLRFDLGVSLAEQGRCAAAMRAFDIGKRLTRTPSFDRAVDVAMDDLCPGLAPYEVSLGFNLAYDTNANSGAADENIIVGGVPLTLSGDAVAKEAVGYQISGNFAYNYRITPVSYIVPSIGVGITDYQGRDLDSYALTAGLSYRYKGDKIDWRVGPMVALNYDHAGLASVGTGAVGRASVILGPRTGLYFNASYLEVVDEDNDLQDYNQVSTGVTLVHNPAGTKYNLRAGLNYTDRDYADDFSDITSTRFEVGVSGSLTDTIGFDVALSHSRNDGGTPHYAFGERHDRLNSLSARASFANLEGWYGRPYVGVSHTISSSTWETKDYDKTRLLVGLTRSF
jgi:hypothetical protein